jgi:hypothetical protein
MSAPKNPLAASMNLRDYFAGQALCVIEPQQALAAARDAGKSPSKFMAGLAYELADAMLSHRQQGEG